MSKEPEKFNGLILLAGVVLIAVMGYYVCGGHITKNQAPGPSPSVTVTR